MNALAGLSMLLAALVCGGCVGTQDGHSQAGLPLIKDNFVSRYDRPLAQVIDAARVVLNRDGVLIADNIVNHSLVAKVNQRTVYVRSNVVDKRVTEVVIQVRSGGGSDLDLARDIDKEIAIQLTIMR